MRWNTEQTRKHIPASLGADLARFLDHTTPLYVEIEDTGASDAANDIHHGLGRVPRSVNIVRQEVPAAPAAPTVLYTRESDEWTESTVRVRFDQANRHVVLEVI